MQSPEVVAGIIGSLLCHYPVPILLAIPAILGILAIARHTCPYPVPTPLVITGTAELLHPGHQTGYAGSAGPGKTLLPSLVIDASASTKHMFRKRSVDLLILTLKTMHCIAMIAGLLCWLLSLHIKICFKLVDPKEQEH